jgi:hypothetical protein
VGGGELDLVRSLKAGTPISRGRGSQLKVVAAPHRISSRIGMTTSPNGPDIVQVLFDAGADPNATTTGTGTTRAPLVHHVYAPLTTMPVTTRSTIISRTLSVKGSLVRSIRRYSGPTNVSIVRNRSTP